MTSEVEVGFVEYRSLAHALWKECLSALRSWRFAKRGRGPQQWFGVYLKGTEIRVAACGPGNIDTAKRIARAIATTSTENG